MRRLLLTAFFLEAGAALIVVPWVPFWERNYFLQVMPALVPLVGNHFVRGAVSGLGVLNIVLGVSELANLLMRRPNGPSPASDTSGQPGEA